MSIQIKALPSIPANGNPFQHDSNRLGTKINNRFVAMYTSRDSNVLVLVDIETGERHELTSNKGE